MPASAVIFQYAGITRNRKLAAFLVVFVTIVLSLLSAAADFDMAGLPDKLMYGNEVFLLARGSRTFGDLLSTTRDTWLAGDTGYLLLNFVLSRLSSNPRFFYFGLSLLNSLLVGTIIMLSRKLGAAGFMWVQYLIQFYHISQNALRQSPAFALAIIGVILTARKKRWIGLFVGLLGLTFHTTAIIFILFWLITVFITSNDRVRRLKPIPLLLVTAFLSANALYVLDLWGAVSGGLYMEYLSTEDYAIFGLGSGQGFSGSDITRIIGAILALAYIYKQRNIKQQGEYGEFPDMSDAVAGVLLLLAVVEVLLIPVRAITLPMQRLIIYAGFATIPAYGILFTSFKKHISRLTFSLVILSPLLLGNRLDREYRSQVINDSLVGLNPTSVTFSVLSALIIALAFYCVMAIRSAGKQNSIPVSVSRTISPRFSQRQLISST